MFNSLNAFAAVAVLLIVQYGNKIPFWDENIGSFIDIKNNFSWKIEECLLPPFKENEWKIKKADI
ncbi:hypothetical protein D3C72_2452110 [compost metagenome]